MKSEKLAKEELYFPYSVPIIDSQIYELAQNFTQKYYNYS